MKILLLLCLAIMPTLPDALKIIDSDLCKICNCTSDTNEAHCIGEKIPVEIFNATYWQKDVNKNESYPFDKVYIHKTLITRIRHIPKIPARILDFSDNNIQIIDPYSFKELTNLTELVLFDNGLSSRMLTPDIFEGHHIAGSYLPLPNLKILRLGANELHTLASNLFEHIEKLEILDLHANPFKVLDHNTIVAITSLTNLRELDLSETELTDLPPHFLHTPRALQKLDLSRNHLKFLPSGLKFAESLQWLSLNENPIVRISAQDGFPRMPNLKVLHMCYMPALEEVGDGAMSGLVALKQLHMSDNNHLTFISAKALSTRENGSESETWPKLDQIFLSNNQLTHLELHLFGNLEDIQDVVIAGNPWTCECENQWMVDTLLPLMVQKHKDNDTTWRNLACAAPIEMMGENLYHLYVHNKTMRCLDLFGDRPERDGTLLVGLLLGVLLTIPIVLGAFFCYRRNMFNLFESGPAAYSRQFYSRTSPHDDDF